MEFKDFFNLFGATDAMDKYKPLQYLVQNDIKRALEDERRARVFTAFDLPVHSHTGTDSSPVAYANLQGAQYIALTRTITLTSAQILLLKTTPIELIPQPSALNVILVEGITARLIYGGTAYTGANNLEFRYTDASGTKVTADIGSAFLDSSASGWQHVAGITTAFAPIAGGSGSNGRIVVCVPTADPAVGNSTITLTLKYRIVASRT